MWFSGFNVEGFLETQRRQRELKEDEGNSERVKVDKRASPKVFKGDSHACFGGKETFSPQNRQKHFIYSPWK
jgi:hypothetical protein